MMMMKGLGCRITRIRMSVPEGPHGLIPRYLRLLLFYLFFNNFLINSFIICLTKSVAFCCFHKLHVYFNKKFKKRILHFIHYRKAWRCREAWLEDSWRDTFGSPSNTSRCKGSRRRTRKPEELSGFSSAANKSGTCFGSSGLSRRAATKSFSITNAITVYLFLLPLVVVQSAELSCCNCSVGPSTPAETARKTP